MNTESEVLNAAVDDWESLDQLFVSIRFEFASQMLGPSIPNAVFWRDRNPSITLNEIARTIRDLVKASELQARREDGTIVTELTGDDVFECWFYTSEKGRQKLVDGSVSSPRL